MANNLRGMQGLATNPLFQLGTGILGQQGRIGPGLQAGVGQLQQAQALQAQQQQAQQQQALAMQQFMEKQRKQQQLERYQTEALGQLPEEQRMAALAFPSVGKQIFEQKYKKEKLPAGLMMGPGGERQIDPLYMQMKQGIARAGAPSTTISPQITFPGAKEAAKAEGKQSAAALEEMRQDAMGARRKQKNISSFQKLIEDQYIGPGADIVTSAMKLGKAAGIDVKGLGKREAAERVANEAKLEAMEMLKGNPSDRDALMVERASFDQLMTKEGIDALSNLYSKRSKEKGDLYQRALSYRKQKGQVFDVSGFGEEEYKRMMQQDQEPVQPTQPITPTQPQQPTAQPAAKRIKWSDM